LDHFAFATHKFSVVLQKFQGKRKLVMAPVLIAKCNLSWVAERERERERVDGWVGGKRLWAKTRIEKGNKRVREEKS
jgi:hypothetical protein